MNLKQIASSTIALLITAVLVLLTGTYTDNAGFQLTGTLLFVTALILAFNQARNRGDSAWLILSGARRMD